MIKTGGKLGFCCDECPICEGLQHRIKIAQWSGDEIQFDHCGCDKVGHQFFAGGYCPDAWDYSHQMPKGKPRKTGRAYRRKMKREAFEKRRGFGSYCYRRAPQVEWDENEYGIMVPVGQYLKRPRNSKQSQFFKRYAAKRVRRAKNEELFGRGNKYRRIFDYHWNVLD